MRDVVDSTRIVEINIKEAQKAREIKTKEKENKKAKGKGLQEIKLLKETKE